MPAQLRGGRFGPSPPWPELQALEQQFRSEGPNSDRFLPPYFLPREPKGQEAGRWPAARAARRRRKGYCECCREAFEELHGVSPSH